MSIGIVNLLAIHKLLGAMLKRVLSFFDYSSDINFMKKNLLLEYAIALIISEHIIEVLLKKNKISFNKNDLKVLKKALRSCAEYEVELQRVGISLELH